MDAIIVDGKVNRLNNKLVDVSNYALNTGIGLRNWNVAKAKGFSGVSNIIFVGDSITDSAGATTFDKGFVGLLRNALQFSSGLAGRGFNANHVIIPDGTWTNLVEGTNLNIFKATSSSNYVTFKDYVSTMDVIFCKKTDGGTDAKIQVDNIDYGTINCNGTTSYHNILTVTGVSPGVHTIKIIPATDGNTYIEGVVCKSGANGILVNQVGHPGIKATDYLNNDSAITATISAFSPLLTVIMLGTNDAYNQVSLLNYQTALDQMVKKALTTGDCLLVSMADQLNGDSLNIPYSDYVETAEQVAINNDCAYLNLYERWNKSYNWANGIGLMADALHPSQIGHSEIANAICETLKISFPANGIFHLHNDAVLPYGDIELTNALSANFIVPDLIKLGVHGGGRNVAITEGASTKNITNGLPDASFSVWVTPSWNTTYWVTNKAWNGFTVNFGTVAPSGATIDWGILR